MLHLNFKAYLIVLLFTLGGSFNLLAQCYKDADCKGNRICVNGVCVNPDTTIPTIAASNHEISTFSPKNTTLRKTSQPLNSNQQIKLAFIGKFGLNIANVWGKYVTELDDEKGFDFNPKAGIIAGGALFIMIHRYFALEPEFLFSMRGSNFSVIDGSSRLEGKEVMNFLEIPINAQLTFPTNSPLTLNVSIAPVVNFLVAAKWTDLKSAEGTSDDIDWMDNTHSAEFGIAFGGGANAEINNTILTFNTRLLFGLTDIRDMSLNDGYKTWALSFIIGTGIKLK
jgi:Outer membrane protein beta-barrel domain